MNTAEELHLGNEEEIKITLVPGPDVAFIWDKVEPILKHAIERADGRWDMFNVQFWIADGTQQLWVAFDSEKKIRGAVTTSVIHYPGRKLLAIQHLAGRNMHEWAPQGLEVLERYAKDNGCDGVEAGGRKGFIKLLQQHGYTHSYTTYQKRI